MSFRRGFTQAWDKANSSLFQTLTASRRHRIALSERFLSSSSSKSPYVSSLSSQGQYPKHKQPGLTWKHVIGTVALSSMLGGAAYVSTRDPGTMSKWSFQVFDLFTPCLRILDPETAHEIGIWFAKHLIVPKETRPDPPSLKTNIWGMDFSNPIGLAAGFDKHAEALDGLTGFGFGFVEVGSITPAPQPGNPKPRIFRISEQKAVINRCGFNSHGIVDVAGRLGSQHGKRQAADRPQGGEGGSGGSSGGSYRGGTGEAEGVLLGVNLGKNKASEDAAGDYLQGIHSLAQYADYLVINVSSPNTPGLRALQGRKKLQELLKRLIAARDSMQWGPQGAPPLLVKIAPDLSHQDMVDIAAVALALRVDGLIVSNTTTSRPDSILGYVHAHQPGGLSGRPLFNLSTKTLSEMYRLTRGKIPLVGCGGVFSGEDAYKKIRAGASLVQIWSALVYEGPGVVPKIKEELAHLLKRDGFSHVSEAVGADHRENESHSSRHR